MIGKPDKEFKILLLEDDPSDQVFVQALLAADTLEYRYIIKIFQCLEDAKKALLNETFDVALLDLNLPDASGEIVFDTIKPLFGRNPILILTGNQDHSLAVKLLEKGAQDYVPKIELSTSSLDRAIRFAIYRYQALSQKVDFIRLLSHQLNTPLNSIIGFSELINRENLDQQDKEYFEYVLDNAKVLNLLVIDLLDIYQLEFGIVSLDKIHFSIEEVVNDFRKFVNQQLFQQNVQFEERTNKDNVKTFFGDKVRIERVLVCIVTALLKMSESKQILFQADTNSCESSDCSEVIFKFILSDNIFKKDQKDLFKISLDKNFYHNQQLFEKDIGVPIAHKFIQLLKGRLEIAELGEGKSVVRVVIPIKGVV